MNAKMKTYLSGMPVLLAVADSGNLTQAAQTLGVSKAAVSQALGQLELALNVRLFQRNTRGMSLTDAGAQLVAQVSEPMLAVHEAVESLQQLDGPVKGELRLTASSVALESLLLPALRRMAVVHPELRVLVDVSDSFVDIVRAGYDAGIRLHGAVDQDMVARQLRAHAPCAVVASPAYLAARGTPQSPEDLAAHDCIGFTLKGRIVCWQFGQAPHVVPVPIQPRLLLNSLPACVSAAREGMGLAYAAPKSLAQRDLDSGALVEVLTDVVAPLPAVMLYYPSRKQPAPKLKALLAVILPPDAEA